MILERTELRGALSTLKSTAFAARLNDLSMLGKVAGWNRIE
jgi:hypothetical protein